MTDERIDPKGIEAAAEPIECELRRLGELCAASRSLKIAEAAIRAADRERGLQEECDSGVEGGKRYRYVRLVSGWRQVERGGEDG